MEKSFRQGWECRPVVLSSWEAEEGKFKASSGYRPAWAAQDTKYKMGSGGHSVAKYFLSCSRPSPITKVNIETNTNCSERV